MSIRISPKDALCMIDNLYLTELASAEMEHEITTKRKVETNQETGSGQKFDLFRRVLILRDEATE